MIPANTNALTRRLDAVADELDAADAGRRLRRFVTFDKLTFVEVADTAFDHSTAPHLAAAVLWHSGEGWAPFVKPLTRADLDEIREHDDVLVVVYECTPLP